MTVAVIGHFCLDVIHHADGTETESYGGIYFSVVTLANLLESGQKVLPVFGVGKTEFDRVKEHLERYPAIDTSGIFKINGETNKVHLYYGDTGEERRECSTHISEPIPWKKIKQSLDTNLILINMVSGNDITLETLDEIRMETRDQHIPVYIDLHSLTLGVHEGAARVRRPLENWRRWLFMLHAVQMNEEESRGLTPDNLPEKELATHALALNTNVLLITRGERGVTAYVDVHKQVQRTDVQGIPAGKPVDPTGCGDVFAAAYCAHYLTTKNILDSVKYANTVASVNASLPGSAQIDQLSKFRLTRDAKVEV